MLKHQIVYQKAEKRILFKKVINMKTNQQILKNRHSQVFEIVNAVEQIAKTSKFSQTGGYGSVRIGNAYIYIEENENTDVYETTQLCDLYIHIGHDEKGCLYATDIKFFDDTAYGGIRSGKYATKDNLVSIRLFKDAYEKIINKIISIDKYCNDIEKQNKEQIDKISTI